MIIVLFARKKMVYSSQCGELYGKTVTVINHVRISMKEEMKKTIAIDAIVFWSEKNEAACLLFFF